MSEAKTFDDFQEARNQLEAALENFSQKVENDDRALIDEFNELLIEVDGWHDLVIVEK